MSRLRDSELLRTPAGQLFLSAQGLDSLASGLANVALPWFILDRGGSIGEAGLVFVGTMLPYVVFGLPAGVIADRFPRRTVIALAHAAQTAAAALVPVSVWLTGSAPLWLVALSAFLIGGGRAFPDAGAFGAINLLVGPAGFTVGQSLLNVAWSLGWVVGPALGGILISLTSPTGALTAETLAFGLATVLILLIRRPLDSTSERPAEHPVRAVFEGLSYIVHDPVVRALTGIGLLYNLVMAGTYGLIVPLLREGVGLTAREVGWALGISSAMGLLSPVIVAATTSRWAGPLVFQVAVAVGNITSIAIALTGRFATALAVMIVLGIAQWVQMAVFIGERQRRAPDYLQARVGISGRMVMTASLGVGALLASLLVGPIGIQHLFMLLGATGLLIGALSTPLILRLARLAPVTT